MTKLTVQQQIEKAIQEKATTLNLRVNQLTALPPEIAQLKQLKELLLGGNQLTALPPEIAQLTQLQILELSLNQLTALPPEIAQLKQLKFVELSSNKLTTLPPGIGQLTQLHTLHLRDNNLTMLPPEIGQLTQLKELFLSGNQLSVLPSEIAQLTQLHTLHLRDNDLTMLPPEIAQLTQLQSLDLSSNKLITLPPEIAQLTQLQSLDLSDNPLISPPLSIVARGTAAVLAFLRAQAESGTPQWVSKLLVVGEGRVGKTSLLRALRNEPFLDQQDSTHGIQIGTLPVQHPEQRDITMQLNTWDFGGQEIYHATHQFFLTDRSLFLLAWNAGLGYEQAKLHYWLETIQALAPNSPVLLVATWSDQRKPDLPLSDLAIKYPQLVGQVEISNRTGAGLQDLRKSIARIASQLPLMGQEFPTTWIHAADAVRERSERHVTPDELWQTLSGNGVRSDEQPIVARWLHDLGDILFFQDREELCDLVILKPQWVSEHISRVLDYEPVRLNLGIFTKVDMRALWHDLEPEMQNHFLRLMEQFDLSYRTLEDKEVSLVVEQLPLDTPDYESLWDRVQPRDDNEVSEISLKYVLSTIPAGVPSWSIARQHRFTTHTHWRNGAVFAYEAERVHLGLLRANTHEKTLRLAVRGPNPHNFFALLQDGVEVTLDRFPGLKRQRFVPCPCGGKDGLGCTDEYDYDNLLERVHVKPTVECRVTAKDVPLSQLLFGLHWQMQDNVTERLEKIEEAVADVKATVQDEGAKTREQTHAQFEHLRGQLDQNAVYIQREFTKIFTIEQQKLDSACPNIFTLCEPLNARPTSWAARWWGGARHKAIGDRLEMHLVCQAPGCWHSTVNGGTYTIERPAQWLGTVAPYAIFLVKFLKFTAPFVAPGLGVFAAQLGLESVKELGEDFESRIKMMEAMVEKLPEFKEEVKTEIKIPDFGIVSTSEMSHKLQPRYDVNDCKELLQQVTSKQGAEELRQLHGASLRAVRKLLEEKDPRQEWGGLERILTPEGHYLWLCEAHAREYRD